MASILLITLPAAKPSTRLRMLPLEAHLRRRGHAVASVEVPRSLPGRLALLRKARTSEVVILQKKLFPASYVGLLRHANPNLIFDVDDAVMFHELERHEPVTGEFFRRFCAIAAASRIVVCGNAYLASFATAARTTTGDAVAILPTPIDTRTLLAKSSYASNDGPVIGWMGTKGNLKQMEPIIGALQKLQAAFPDARLRIVADRGIELPGIHTETKLWSATDEADDLRHFDIGIMPLEDNPWNRGKGGYKLLQYMAAGLPAIASPVGINCDILQSGKNGYLADTPNTWLHALTLLSGDTALRQRIGNAARATVEGRYALDGYLEHYTTLIEGLLQ